MWPLLIDMTKDESIQSLRNLELEAYSHLVSALRAQGPLNPDKRKLLRETSCVLNISQERHKAEIRRALTDEKLTTIAFHVNAQNEYNSDWAQEGRRVIPLMPRMAPQTAFSAMADEVAENADLSNKQLPLPANTERKRSMIVQSNQNILGDCNKGSFRINEQPKHEELRKRKFSENSSLAQHLLGPSNKMSRIQQIYRQKTKSKTKEQFTKVKMELDQSEVLQNKTQHPVLSQKPQMVKIPMNSNMNTPSANGSKINILQNINLQQSSPLISEDHSDQVPDINNSNMTKLNEANHIASPPFNINENINNRLKFLTKSNNIMFKPLNTSSGTNMNMELQKTLKVCPSRKPIAKAVPTTNQKLIVVSNAQTMPNSSILQRTLTIPFVKNISVKNFDKFKIVSTSGAPVTLATSTVNSNSFNSVKHKVVTVRTSNPVNTGKKVLPITQLQMLNKGSIKVLPLGGKIVGKTTTSAIPSSMYIMNSMGNMQNLTKTINTLPIAAPTKIIENIDNTQIVPLSTNPETGSSNCARNMEKLKELTKNSSVVNKVITVDDDYDNQIEEFHIETVPEDAVVEVKSEEDIEEVVETVEVDKSGIVCLPEIDCYISDGEVIETESRLSPEREMKESSNESCKNEDFSDDQLNNMDHRQEIEEIVYVDN
ncbi:BRCA2-interacting transcriptional repressor EMSY [Harmonia axyridis]|uniref:BRCA2-interacting transcriptional repressor EMSY n=1 Tax=Harmonia axyridis TaxID=115357 RepID=UPI001E279697|nr:BRCA2-interacting transcriptional repressor EMSY [Harmonia axyridis]